MKIQVEDNNCGKSVGSLTDRLLSCLGLKTTEEGEHATKGGTSVGVLSSPPSQTEHLDDDLLSTTTKYSKRRAMLVIGNCNNSTFCWKVISTKSVRANQFLRISIWMQCSPKGITDHWSGENCVDATNQTLLGYNKTQGNAMCTVDLKEVDLYKLKKMLSELSWSEIQKKKGGRLYIGWTFLKHETLKANSLNCSFQKQETEGE